MRRLVVLLFVPSVAWAVPMELSHQGRLFESGIPVSGPHDVVVSLHTAASGGSEVFAETFAQHDFDDGYFNVVLGTDALGNPLDTSDFDPNDLWVQVELDGTVLADRLKIASVPFAIRAETAANLDEGASIDVAEIKVNGTTVIDSFGEFQGTGLDTLGELNCAFGQIAVFGGTDWVCADQPTGGGTGGGPVQWTDILGIPVELTDGDDDSFADKTCGDDETLIWSDAFGTWGCTARDWDGLANMPAGFADGTDDVLDEAAVDAYVANNGYAMDADISTVGKTGDFADLGSIPSGLLDGDDILDEASVDSYVANNGYAMDADISTVGKTGDFTDLGSVPSGLMDGDDDTQLDEAAVDGYVANNGYALASSIATVGTSGAFADLTGIPSGLSDGDDDTQLDEAAVDAFVANNGYALDADIATVGKTGNWTDIAGMPGDFSDGVDNVLSEATVETYITNAAIDLADGSSVQGTLTVTGDLDVTGAVRQQPIIYSGYCNSHGRSSGTHLRYCLNVTEFDTGTSQGYWTVNTSGVINVATSGYYRIRASAISNVASTPHLLLWKNGAYFHHGHEYSGNSWVDNTADLIWPFNAGDSFEVTYYSNGGSNYNYHHGSAQGAYGRLQFEYVGPL